MLLSDEEEGKGRGGGGGGGGGGRGGSGRVWVSKTRRAWRKDAEEDQAPQRLADALFSVSKKTKHQTKSKKSEELSRLEFLGVPENSRRKI